MADYTLLTAAVETRDMARVNDLFAVGADVTRSGGKHNEPPLLVAVRHGHSNVVQM